jgi:para-nitrobenzyl esterase
MEEGMKRSHAGFAVFVCVLISIFLAGCGSSNNNNSVAAPDNVIRTTQFGAVQGVNDASGSGTYSWLGVPFAAPPVGALRWKAPVDPAPWSSTLATQKFGNACVQYGRIYGPGSNNTYDATIGTTLNQAVGSEDCLYLNIWRPSTDSANLPVIVFIYGGSDVSGYTADPTYNGANLAKTANAVVVTINYRVGLFGWLNLAQLKTGKSVLDDSGNFGTLDNIKALEFIKSNIVNFGGNPNNVTVTGQSAGAINVYALMVSPLTQIAGLFQKAAAFSGGISLASELPAGSIATLTPAATYATQGNTLLWDLLIADGLATDTTTAQAYVATQTNAQIATYMRSKTPSAIFTQLLTKLALLGLSGSGPIPEGTVVPADPVANITAGAYTKVPFLASNARDEAKLFASFLALAPALGGKAGLIVNDATRFTMMANFNPDAAPTLTDADLIDASYLPVTTPGTGYNAKTDLLNSIFFIPSRDNVLTALAANQSNIWYYQFNWAQEPAPWNDVYGAAHAFDLGFLFGNFGPNVFSNAQYSTANKPGRLALSSAMMNSLGAFASSGDPNNAMLGVTWPVWPAKLWFDATLTDKVISVH